MQAREHVNVKEGLTVRGLCRTYYTPLNKKDKRLFCLTDDGNWYICSRDGEPSHQPDYDLNVLTQKK